MVTAMGVYYVVSGAKKSDEMSQPCANNVD